MEMNFRAFKEKYGRYPLIKSSYFSLEKNPAYLRRLVSEWRMKGWLIELRRGMYLINDSHTLQAAQPTYIANQLYAPSYVSLEWALSYYGLIPEAVRQVTSVSTRKTAIFTNELGRFSYAHIKKTLFWGFSKLHISQPETLMAHPEKALCDMIYLRRGELKSAQEVLESLRLQNMEILSLKRMREYHERYGSPKVSRVLKELAKKLRKEKK